MCQYTGDVAILARHDKMIVMLVFTYHTDGMCVSAGVAILQSLLFFDITRSTRKVII